MPVNVTDPRQSIELPGGSRRLSGDNDGGRDSGGGDGALVRVFVDDAPDRAPISMRPARCEAGGSRRPGETRPPAATAARAAQDVTGLCADAGRGETEPRSGRSGSCQELVWLSFFSVPLEGGWPAAPR